MIGIQLQGDTEFLDTLPTTAITVKLENPIFGDPEKLSPGSYSFSFDLPGSASSPKNASKLKNPQVIENVENYVAQKASLFFKGVPFKSGSIKANAVNDNRISAFFTFGLNQVNPYFKTARLKNILINQFTTFTSAITKKIYLKQITADDLNLTINGKEYTEPNSPSRWTNLAVQLGVDGFNETLDKADKWYPKISAISASGSTPSGLITGGFITFSLTQFYTVSPGVYAERDCTDPLELLSIEIADDFISNYTAEVDLSTYYSEIESFMASYSTSTPTSPAIRFPVMFNNKLHADVVRDEIINGCDTGGFIMNNPNWGIENGQPFVVKNFNSLQPFASLKFILDRIAGLLGYDFDGDWYEDLEVQDILIDNSVVLDVPQLLIGSNKFVFYKKSFALRDLVPDVTVVDFLKSLQSRYNIAMYINEITGKVTLSKREGTALRTNYEEHTNITLANPDHNPERFAGYSMRVESETDDAFSQVESVVVGTPEAEYPVNCGRLFSQKSIYNDGGLIEGPYKSQLSNVKFNLRVFHYLGIVNNGSYDYPAASIHSISYNEDLATIHERFWKYWLHFERNRLVIKTTLNFPFRSVRQIDWELKRRVDRNNYLIKSIEAKISNQDFEISSVELYTMK